MQAVSPGWLSSFLDAEKEMGEISDAGFMRQLSDNSISHGLPRATQNGLLKVLKQHTS